MEKKVVEITKKVKPKSQIIFSSFNIKVLKKLVSLKTKHKLGFTFWKMHQFKDNQKFISENVDFILPWFFELNNNLDFYKSTNIKMISWTFQKNNKYDEWSDNWHKYYEKIKNLKNIEGLICNSKF